MLNREDVIFRMELLASKDGGERVPLVVELGRLLDDEKGICLHFVYRLDGVVRKERKLSGDDFDAVCHVISSIRTGLELFYYRSGYVLYRRVGTGDAYVEVSLDDLFPNTIDRWAMVNDKPEDVMFRMELLASKDGGERVPLVVELHRPEKQEGEKLGEKIWVVCVLNGVVHRKMHAYGGGGIHVIGMGIAMARIELEHTYCRKGYVLYRRVGAGDAYVEVSLDDLFPYTREIGK